MGEGTAATLPPVPNRYYRKRDQQRRRAIEVSCPYRPIKIHDAKEEPNVTLRDSKNHAPAACLVPLLHLLPAHPTRRAVRRPRRAALRVLRRAGALPVIVSPYGP
jgi:hypothetical protein